MMFEMLNSNTTGVTHGGGAANPAGAHEITLVFSGVIVVYILFSV